MNGYNYVVDEASPHTGGNIWQGDPWTFAPSVWKFMIDRFAVQSVLDVGSGRGHAAHWFHKNGCKVLAVDGNTKNVNNALYPTVYHDFADGPFTCRVDMIHCQEVVEHIHEQYLPYLLHTFTNADVILMTHAQPGQPGHHHVNCQTSNYWIEKLESVGFGLAFEDTRHVKDEAIKDNAHHIIRSGMVFVRNMP